MVGGGIRVDGSNRTPVGRRPVSALVADHGGVPWWTEFHTPRAIALHEYWPVDGTALSMAACGSTGRWR